MSDKPSILLSWCKDLDYPFIRWQINKNRKLFDKVILVMTQQVGNQDFSEFLEKKGIINPTIIRDYYDDGSDWRNAAINEGLKSITSSKVLFLEQDFLFIDGFFQQLIEKSANYRAVGFTEGNRFHPACLLVDKTAVDMTKKDFSVDKDVGDHFCKFSSEIRDMGNWETLGCLALPKWFHLAGTTQNYRMALEGKFEQIHMAGQFYTYNKYCRTVPTVQSQGFTTISEAIDKLMGKIEEDEFVKSFFERREDEL